MDTLSQLSESSRIDTVTFRGGGVTGLFAMNWQYTNSVRSPIFGQNLSLGVTAQTKGLKFPRGYIPLVEYKVFNSG